MVQSFLPPAEEHEVEFVSIIFVIEHIFLIIFLFLRNILSKQRCQADVLKERRTLKRGIKKYLNKVVLSDMIRDSFVGSVFNRISQTAKEEETNASASFLDSFMNLAAQTEQKGEAEMAEEKEKAE